MLGFDMAMEEGGEWLLRIEDIDRQRSKPEWEQAIYDDLEWLGCGGPTGDAAVGAGASLSACAGRPVGVRQGLRVHLHPCRRARRAERSAGR
jgi:hypothetical protein